MTEQKAHCVVNGKWVSTEVECIDTQLNDLGVVDSREWVPFDFDIKELVAYKPTAPENDEQSHIWLRNGETFTVRIPFRTLQMIVLNPTSLY